MINMKKNILYITILFVLAVLTPNFAYAEVGFDYDRQLLSSNSTTNTFEWASHYDRTWDGSQWINYLYSETPNEIIFKSASMYYTLDKNDCSFSLLNPNTEQISIGNYQRTFTINGLPVVLSKCSVGTEQNEDGVVVTALQSNGMMIANTTFNIKAFGVNEWTYELTNTDSKDQIMGIEESCTECSVIKVDGDIIDFDIYKIDTKNPTHNTVQTIDTKDGLTIVYQDETKAPLEQTIIDPTATLTTSTDDSPIEDDNDNICEDTGGTYTQYDDISAYSLTYGTAATNDCGRLWSEFDITSITDSSTVTDMDYKFQGRTLHSDISHRIYGMKDFQPSTRTAAQNFDEIDDGTLFVTTTLSPLGVYTIDLTATADTELTNVLATSQNYYSIGVRPVDETLSASVRGQAFYSVSGGVQVPQLIVVYTESVAPNAPTNLKTNTASTTQIDLSWTTPSQCGTGCTGYKIWSESPTGNGFTVLVSNTTTTATTYSNSGLSAGTQYNYKLAAWNHVGLGTNSSASANYTITSAPTSVTHSLQTNATMRTTWTAPSPTGALTGYKIERETPIGGGFATIVANTGNTTLHYDNTGLSGGTQYNVRISAINSGGTSAASTDVSNYTKTSPPTSLSATAISDTQINLSWTAPSPAGSLTGYKIERESPTGGGFSTLVANTTTTATTYSDSGLTQSTQYNYRVSAINHAGTSLPSNQDDDTTLSSTPNAPTNLKPNTSSTTQIDLSWTTPSYCNGICTGYKIWSESPTGNGFTVLVSNTTTTATTYSDSGLSAGTQYNYKLAAWNHFGLGTNSSASANYTITSAPTSVTHSLQTTTTMRSSWTAPSPAGGLSGYKIERETPIGGGFATIVANTGNATLHYDNTGLSAGTQYNVRISAINSGGTSAASTAVSNYTKTSPPTSLSVIQVSQTQINLSWTAPSPNGALTGYKIERETPIGGGFTTIVADTGTTATTYSNSGLTPNTQYNYRVSAINQGGTSLPSNEDDASTTIVDPTATLTIITNRTGDAIELIPSVTLTAGIPDPFTVINIKVLKNGTSINSTALSNIITVSQTISLGRTFAEQLDADFIYNFTGIVIINNSTSMPFQFNSSAYMIPPEYTGNYFTSSEGNYQINYTHSRTNAYQNLNLVINRQNLPVNTECNFRDELFESGNWVNVSNSGWYNQTLSVAPTQNVYITCYNDQLLFGAISYGGSNSTLAFVDFMNQLGTFAGVPVPFLFILLMAGLFTGRSAITGIIFVAITIGVMGTMGFLPDINGDPAIGGVTWALIVFLTGIGIFVGKKYF